MKHDKVVILDFGSQYTQLIARRVRELNIFCEIHPYHSPAGITPDVKAIILSGSPYSVLDEDAPIPRLKEFAGIIPILGICYGAQYIAHDSGGTIQKSGHREYGKSVLKECQLADPIVKDVDLPTQVWMSHGDSIIELPDDFTSIATTNDINVAIFKKEQNNGLAPLYGFQFHPEVTHTDEGLQFLSNFLIDIAGCRADWTPAAFVEETVQSIRETVGEEGVLMALSGGVDSTVAAVLIQQAVGDQLTCLFIDNGLLRYSEYEGVLESYEGLGLSVHGVDARDVFYGALKGISDPEIKRKKIGAAFISVFEEEAAKMSRISWLGQGTIYPDVIESVSVHGPSVTIKSHHNVGGLPEHLNLQLVEPLRMLFKDEVRKVGQELDIPSRILRRHPFPGPGLGIRILGEITPEKVHLIQQADYIFITALQESGLYDKVWQAAAILLPIQSVGVMGDERTYERAVALRAVNSVDGMTATWSELPFEFLAQVSSEIINKVKGINRVVYDISTKPPSTIEWE